MTDTATAEFPAPKRRHRRTPATAAVGVLVATVGVVAVAGQGQAASSSVADRASDALVTVVSTEGYAGTASAGTGMVLSTTGEILTNNHVVAGATSIRVTVVSTGRSYSATVVGTDATDDVAVIQLKNASGLETLPIDRSTVEVGDDVTATGNAGGTGNLTTVSGDVTATDQTITASDGEGSAETLHGLIETDAPIVAGDSGGALIDGDGEVIGMNTAASASEAQESTGYAIPIASALTIAAKITSGQASDTVTIGTHGFLGVQLQPEASSGGYGSNGYGSNGYGSNGYGSNGFGAPGYGYGSTSTTSGATIGGVVQGGPAEAAGLSAGDTITAVNGTAVADADALNAAMATTRSGQSVTITWTDTDGGSYTASVTLTAAPAA